MDRDSRIKVAGHQDMAASAICRRLGKEALLIRPLEPTTLPHADAKIAGKAMCGACQCQHGFEACTVMPANVHGVGDGFDRESSHVAAGHWPRSQETAEASSPEVTTWGTEGPLADLPTQTIWRTPACP